MSGSSAIMVVLFLHICLFILPFLKPFLLSHTKLRRAHASMAHIE